MGGSLIQSASALLWPSQKKILISTRDYDPRDGHSNSGGAVGRCVHTPRAACKREEHALFECVLDSMDTTWQFLPTQICGCEMSKLICVNLYRYKNMKLCIHHPLSRRGHHKHLGAPQALPRQNLRWARLTLSLSCQFGSCPFTFIHLHKLSI